MQPTVIRIDSPIQTIEKFSEVSGFSVRKIRELMNEGLIPFEQLGERSRVVNVVKYANQIANGEKATKSEKPTIN